MRSLPLLMKYCYLTLATVPRSGRSLRIIKYCFIRCEFIRLDVEAGRSRMLSVLTICMYKLRPLSNINSEFSQHHPRRLSASSQLRFIYKYMQIL